MRTRTDGFYKGNGEKCISCGESRVVFITSPFSLSGTKIIENHSCALHFHQTLNEVKDDKHELAFLEHSPLNVTSLDIP